MSEGFGNFLKGLYNGILFVLPLIVLGEHIRYGFFSMWLPMWMLFVIPVAIGFILSRGMRIGFVWRIVFFVEYILCVGIILWRTLRAEGLLMAVLLMGVAYAAFLIFGREK